MSVLALFSPEAGSIARRLQRRDLHQRRIWKWPGQQPGCRHGRLQRQQRWSHGNWDPRSPGRPQQSQQHWQNKLHQQATDRTGEGIPFQQVPDTREEDRDSFCFTIKRNTSKNLVSESSHETEETNEGRFNTHRTYYKWRSWC